MNKNDIAKNINATEDLFRTLVGNFDENDFIVGKMYNNRSNAEGWTKDGIYYVDENVMSGVEVYLSCEDVDCHKVDYNNTEECEMLGCDNCEKEDEYLVSAETKMLITDVTFQYEENYNNETDEFEQGELLEIHVTLKLA